MKLQYNSIYDNDLNYWIKYIENEEINFDWSFSNFKHRETSKLTHGYHRYPAKFIPQLVEKLFNEYIHVDNPIINDPFMGCGTTIVSGLTNGYRVTGTDINRLACLITKVKAVPLNPVSLEQKLSFFIKDLNLISSNNKNIVPLIPENYLDKISFWFNEENIIKLGKILSLIRLQDDSDFRDFLLVAFSHILKECSIWLSSSTKLTRDLRKIPADPFIAIKRHLYKMEKGNFEYFNIIPQHVKNNIGEHLMIFNSDASKQPIESGSIDLIVTSSPYVTSYEYADLHMLSTIWLELADDVRTYRKQFIGSSTRQSNQDILQSKIAQNIVQSMKCKNEKSAKEIEAFFEDMQNVLKESHRILRKGHFASYVIGNTKLKGIHILNAEVFTELMLNLGFKIEQIIKRPIPSKRLPQTRDEKTGKFAKSDSANNYSYPIEYIIIAQKV